MLLLIKKRAKAKCIHQVIFYGVPRHISSSSCGVLWLPRCLPAHRRPCSAATPRACNDSQPLCSGVNYQGNESLRICSGGRQCKLSPDFQKYRSKTCHFKRKLYFFSGEGLGPVDHTNGSVSASHRISARSTPVNQRCGCDIVWSHRLITCHRSWRHRRLETERWPPMKSISRNTTWLVIEQARHTKFAVIG